MTKANSLYQEGLKPLLYSTTDEALNGVGWKRCGENISYFPNKQLNDTNVPTYALTFTVHFPHDNDTTYFAYCYPYTYTDLQDYLLEICTHPIKSIYTSLKILCKSLAGNNLYYLTVTSAKKSSRKQKRNTIVISARVHPGETPSSWIMKGLLDYITGDSTIAIHLRQKFVFVLVPMLNPDGVIIGNTRYSLAGKDLNREYKIVSQESCLSIWYMKLMMERIIKERGIALYCDLHAHSRKHNIFMYGCNNQNGEKDFEMQMFPLMLHKNASHLFSFDNYKFHVQKTKEGSGRVVMWSMGILNSFTMEASFGGTLLGERAATHFTIKDYEDMGHYLCKTIFDYYERPTQKKKPGNLKIIFFTILATIFICVVLTLLTMYVFIKY